MVNTSEFELKETKNLLLCRIMKESLMPHWSLPFATIVKPFTGLAKLEALYRNDNF